MSGHTPGPWQYDADDEVVFRVTGDGSTDEDIAQVSTSHEDGRLIAAAPDLLKVARLSLLRHADVDACPCSFCSVVRAAIAKAGGK